MSKGIITSTKVYVIINMHGIRLIILIACLLCSSVYSNAQETKIFTVKPAEIKAAIQPTMWGVFFEDINFGADGGIYAELIKNRSFEFYKPLMGWKALGKPKTEGDFLVLNRESNNTTNPRFLRVTVHDNNKDSIGLSNEGFRGIGIKKDLRYDFSLMYNLPASDIKMHVELISAGGQKIGNTTFIPVATGNTWKKGSISFTATATEPKGKLNIWFEGNGTIDLDMISLFPSDTWKGRPGGMRNDMIQLLADMKPGFIRFPGGCIVEGHELSTRYQWKKTIGPIEERQLIINRWNSEFAHRPAPDYFQTFGLGFFEYFQLAEDLGAEPIPILNAGMACQFNTAEVAPLDQLDPYVQDALDLIEFANGDVTTEWGKIRAQMGHAATFNLKIIGVGNENWGPQYIERLKLFTKAIKSKYPNIKLVGSSGTDPEFKPFTKAGFEYLDNELRKMNTDIIDEHYYRRPEWFLENANRYDSYDRKGPKIFAGEYAAQSKTPANSENRNNWQSALSEAAFMTGLERNADVVVMASYAPLFAHAEAWQWTPDMIWVDNLQSYGTPNYYAQKMFSTNKGTNVVPVLWKNKVIAGQDSLYASAVIDKNTSDLIIKIVNTSGKQQNSALEIEGIKNVNAMATLTILKGQNLSAVNSFTNPANVKPIEQQIQVKGKRVPVLLAPFSFYVIKIKMK